jgi:hypothetical protein
MICSSTNVMYVIVSFTYNTNRYVFLSMITIGISIAQVYMRILSNALYIRYYVYLIRFRRIKPEKVGPESPRLVHFPAKRKFRERARNFSRQLRKHLFPTKLLPNFFSRVWITNCFLLFQYPSETLALVVHILRHTEMEVKLVG